MYTIALTNARGYGLDVTTATSLQEVRQVARDHMAQSTTFTGEWSTDDGDLVMVWKGYVKVWSTMEPHDFGFVPGPRGGLRRRDW